MITSMTPQPVLDPVPIALPDVLWLDLEDMAALDPVALDQAVRRVLPDCPPETVTPGTAFASSI